VRQEVAMNEEREFPVDLWVVSLDEKHLVEQGQLRLIESFRGTFVSDLTLDTIHYALNPREKALSQGIPGIVNFYSPTGLILNPWEKRNPFQSHLFVEYMDQALAREIGADPNAQIHFHEESPFNTKEALLEEVLLLLSATYAYAWTQRMGRVSDIHFSNASDPAFLAHLQYGSVEFGLTRHTDTDYLGSAIACKVLPNCGTKLRNGLVLAVTPQWSEHQAEVSNFLMAWFMRRVKEVIDGQKRRLERDVFGVKP